MGLEIKSNLFPYRMVLKRKEPVELRVEVANRSADKKLVSLQIALARAIAFDRGGLENGAVNRLGELQPNEAKEFYFKVYPKQGVKTMSYPIQIRVFEHFNSYDYIARKVVKNLELKVEE
jgi:uncharacterized membrane protein